MGMIALTMGINSPSERAIAHTPAVGKRPIASIFKTSLNSHKAGDIRTKAAMIEGRTNINDFRIIKPTKLFWLSPANLKTACSYVFVSTEIISKE